MKRLLASVAVFSALLGLLVTPARAQDWEKFYEKDGFLGYEREVPGSDFPAYKAQCLADAGMDVIAMVLRDTSACTKWLTQCSRAEVLEKYDENSMLLHVYFDSPWPVSDRDAVVKNTFAMDPEKAEAVIELIAVGDAGPPPEKGVVRIPKMEGRISLEYMGRDRTRMTYESVTDPGGNLSPSMVGMTTRYYPIQYLQGICELAKEPRYRKAAQGSKERANLDSFAADPESNHILLQLRCEEYVRNSPVTRRVVEDPGSGRRLVDSGSTYEGVSGEVDRALMACLDSPGVAALFTDEELIRSLGRPTVGPRVIKRSDEAIFYMFLSGESLEESLARIARSVARDRNYKEIERIGP